VDFSPQTLPAGLPCGPAVSFGVLAAALLLGFSARLVMPGAVIPTSPPVHQTGGIFLPL